MACACRKNLLNKWQKKKDTTRIVLLDYCAGAPTEPEVLKEYFNLVRKYPGHTGSLHPAGLEAADFFDRTQDELSRHRWFKGFTPMTFPSASTFFYMLERIFPERYFYCTVADHPSVINALSRINEDALINVHADGTMDLEDALLKIKEPALFVSFAVGHETGACQDWHKIKNAFATKDVLFGIDMVQVPGRENFQNFSQYADFFVISPYKFGGLKSMSLAAFNKKSLKASKIKEPIDSAFMPGPKDPALFGAQVRSISLWTADSEIHSQKKMAVLDDYFIKTLEQKNIPYSLNSPKRHGAGILNISFPFLTNMELFFQKANDAGISVSRFSACTEDINGPSAILLACGFDVKRASTSLRISSGISSAEEDYRLLANLLSDFQNIR